MSIQDRCKTCAKPLVEAIDDLMAGVPDEALAAVPTDLAAEHDHYLYGTPKVFPQSLRDLRKGLLHDHADAAKELG